MEEKDISNTIEGKICSTCNEFKYLYEYYKNKDKPMGFECQCKQCRKKVKKLYYQNNKEKYKQYYKDFIIKNPDYQSIYYIKNKIKNIT